MSVQRYPLAHRPSLLLAAEALDKIPAGVAHVAPLCALASGKPSCLPAIIRPFPVIIDLWCRIGNAMMLRAAMILQVGWATPAVEAVMSFLLIGTENIGKWRFTSSLLHGIAMKTLSQISMGQ